MLSWDGTPVGGRGGSPLRRVGRRAMLAGAAALLAGAGATLAQGMESARASRLPIPPLTLLVGSGGGPTEPPFAAQAATTLVGAFRAQEPAARVRVSVARSTLVQVASAMLGGRDVAADLMLVPPAVRDLPNAGVLMHSLTPTLRATGVGAGVYPSLLTYCSAGGRLLSAPLFRDPLVVYYNVDAFARAGVPALPGDWTLQGFMDVCRVLAGARTRPVPHPLANAVARFDAELLGAFIAGFGGGLGAADLDGLASPAGVRGVEALLALRAFEPVTPVPSPRDLFARAGAAMYFGHQRDLAYLTAAIGDLFAWNVASLPRFPARAAVPVQAQGLAVVTGQPGHRPEATALALFGVTPSAQAAAAPTGAGVPSLRGLAASALWRAPMPPVDLSVFVRQPEADLVIPPALWTTAPLQRALRDCLQGTPPAEALAAARAALALAPWGP